MDTPVIERTAANAVLEPSVPSRRSRGVTSRVVVFSLLMAAVFGYCIPIIDYKLINTFFGAMHMPAGAVAVLLFLVLVVNPLLKRLPSRWRLDRNEVLTVYITCLFSALVPGRGGETFFIPNVLSSFYYATRENKWMDMLAPYVKPWITPALSAPGHYNEAVVSGYYVGLPPGDPIPWGAWLVPLAAWLSIILSIYVMHGCLGVMLRAQWAGNEALAFPLLRLPLELTEDLDKPTGEGNGFWKNPLMWVGFGVAVFIELLNGLNLYFPDIPAVPLQVDTTKMFTEAPWNQIGSISIRLYLAIVGISYLLTSDVSFSLWFFHLFTKAQLVFAYYLGFMPAAMDQPFWTRGGAKGLIGYQQVGAILAYVALVAWTGREHWKHITRRAFGRESARPGEKDEPLSYPIAFWGFLAALTFILCWTVAAGVKPHVAVLLWGFYLVISFALTRLVVEGGLLFVQTGWLPIGPLAFLVGGGPGKVIDVASAMPASLISNSLMLDMRGFLLPSFVQGFKLAHDRKIAMRPLVMLIVACVLVSLGTGLCVIVRMGYMMGGLSFHTWWVTGANMQQAQHAIGIMKGIDTNFAANWGWVGVGALMTWGMMLARSRVAWFPFHPIGLLMCLPFAMQTMWGSIFLGWLCKVTITRFGGNDAYRKATPLFLGLTLGSVVMMILWAAIDAWQGRGGHALLPT